ncbi:MAG: response regulator transcription factor [Bdellovibrionia bacterium]
MKTDKTIWILEDDPESQFVYSDILEVRYNVKFFTTLKEFAKAGPLDGVDLLIADLKLPDGHFISHLHEKQNRARVTCDFIVVSSMDDLDVLRACFNDGASDFLSKPFKMNTLIVKIENILAKQQKHGISVAQLDGVTLHPHESCVRRKEYPSSVLTSKEFEILTVIVQGGKEGVSREFILSQIWNDLTVNQNTLDVHLSNLRKKLAFLALDLMFLPHRGYILADRMRKEIQT